MFCSLKGQQNIVFNDTTDSNKAQITINNDQITVTSLLIAVIAALGVSVEVP